MQPGIKAVKDMFGLPPNRRHLFEDQKITGAPRTGRGFVYRMSVERAGLNNAEYFGLTRRSILTREKEHIADAFKVAPINPESFPKSGYSFDSSLSLIAAILSTAMGTVTNSPNKERSYLTTHRMFEPSLFVLGDYEESLIDGKHATSLPSNINYHYLRHIDILNKSKGGEGVYWKGLSTLDRAVASIYFIKEESNISAIRKYCETSSEKSRKAAASRGSLNFYTENDYFLTILFSLYSGKNKIGETSILGKLKDGVDRVPNPSVLEMIRLIDIYFGIGELANKLISEKAKTSTIDRNVLQSLIVRKGLREDNTHTAETLFIKLQEGIETFRKEALITTGGALYTTLIDKGAYIQKANAQKDFQKTFKEVSGMILDDFNHVMQEIITKTIEKKLKGGK